MTPRPSPRSATGPTTLRYIESSALVAALLEGDVTVTKTPRSARQVTSALTFAEAGRAIVRARAGHRITEEDAQAATRALQTFERRCFILDIDQSVLGRVQRPFPIEPIRTLDAIHLATAEILGEPPSLVTIVTRDRRVRENAKALGYVVE